jgi:hypothetical protein
MSGKASRTKGHSFERTIAEDFRTVGFPKARTSRQVSRIADDCKIDIVGVFPYAPQCKALRKYASLNEVLKIEWEKYVSIADTSGNYMTPLLITKGDRQPTMVALPWKDFMNILTTLHASRN